MFCPKCGQQNDDNAVFCMGCGERLNNQQPPTNNPGVQNPTGGSEVRYSSNPILNEIKKFVVSPLVLIAVAALALSIILNIATAGDIASNVLDGYFEVLEDMGLENDISKELDDVLDFLDGTFTVIAIIAMLPSIIICTVLLIAVYTAFDKRSDTMSVGGFTAIKILNIIKIVGSVLGIIGMLISFFALTGQVGFNFILFIVYAIIIGVMVFNIYYLIKVNDAVSCFMYSVQSQYPAIGVSSLITVMTFISGGAQIIGCLFGGTFASWLSAISTICFALITIKYRALTEYMRKTYYSSKID